MTDPVVRLNDWSRRKKFPMSENQVAGSVASNPADGIREPPKTLLEALRQIGPGIILAGTIVGSGELILTTAIGAKHGFVFLWLILFSCVIKVFVQVELGRYAISSGKPTLGALQQVSSRRWIGNLLLFWWLAMMLCTVFQLGGMTGGVSQSLDMAFPSMGERFANNITNLSSELGGYLGARHDVIWAILTCMVVIGLIFRGSYRRIEWITTILVVGVTVVTVVATLALVATAYSPNLTSVWEGLAFKIPQAESLMPSRCLGLLVSGRLNFSTIPTGVSRRVMHGTWAQTTEAWRGNLEQKAGSASCTWMPGLA